MNVETKTPEIANRRATLNAMGEKDFTIHKIEQVLQGAILGKGKAELVVRSAIFTNSDLNETRGDVLEGILRKSTSPDLDSVNTPDLANLIGLQMRAVALSKKEKGVEDENLYRIKLREEVVKDDGFCKKVYEYTQDPVNKERVGEALQLLAADLDKNRLDAKVELHNETLTEGHLNAMILNKDLVGIKDQRDQAEVGEEIPVLNDKQKERVHEHVATKRLLEEEIKTKEKKLHDFSDLGVPEKRSGIRVNRVLAAEVIVAGVSGSAALLLAKTAEALSTPNADIAGLGIFLGLEVAANLYLISQLPHKPTFEIDKRNFIFDSKKKTWNITHNGIALRFSEKMFDFLQDEHSVQERNRILDEYADEAKSKNRLARWWYLKKLAKQKPLEVISSS